MTKRKPRTVEDREPRSTVDRRRSVRPYYSRGRRYGLNTRWRGEERRVLPDRRCTMGRRVPPEKP